jgi:pyrroline-5-carboxylate reductase
MANSEKQVAVIGAGVMGEALISALITYGISPSAITISEKREERALELIIVIKYQGLHSVKTLLNAT